MPRGEKIATEAFGVIAEHAELDFAITKYVGVGCAAFAVFVEEVLEHLVAILLGEIRVVERNIQLLADLPGVLKVCGGRAIAVIVLPVGHVQGMHIGASLFEQDRGHGRVNASRQTENDSFVCYLFIKSRFHGRRILLDAAPA